MEDKTAPPMTQQAPASGRRWGRWKWLTVSLLLLIGGYLVTVYLVIPALWKRHFERHPALDDVPGLTHTADGIPGDPINVALIGTREELIKAMLAARWHPADGLTFHSCVAIAVDTVFRRPDPEAPVSNLYLFGRKQGLAFEMAVGDSPRKRHHVRFWKAHKTDPDGRPVWVGSATYDMRVEISRTTGQVTHRIAADVDAERDFLFRTLDEAHVLSEQYEVADFHKARSGKNGGGDPWHTDGALWVGVIDPEKAR
jgi:hypothetical protein